MFLDSMRRVDIIVEDFNHVWTDAADSTRPTVIQLKREQNLILFY